MENNSWAVWCWPFRFYEVLAYRIWPLQPLDKWNEQVSWVCIGLFGIITNKTAVANWRRQLVRSKCCWLFYEIVVICSSILMFNEVLHLYMKNPIIDLRGTWPTHALPAMICTYKRWWCLFSIFLLQDLYLYYFMTRHPGRTLVFTNSIDCIRRLLSVFNLLKKNLLPLHANMHQKQRLKNLERFCEKYVRSIRLQTTSFCIAFTGMSYIAIPSLRRQQTNYIND